MSFKFFKSNSARRHLPNVLANIQAIDKRLKPCYLWDAFAADIVEIELFLKELRSTGLIEKKLSVISICDTALITEYENLKSHIDKFCVENVYLVDVSKSQDLPSLLPAVEKERILAPVLRYAQDLLSKSFDNSNSDKILHIDTSICNVTTLFGTLLGYPVIYWYSPSDSDFTCLSMLPLKVYRIMSTITPKFHSTTTVSFHSTEELFSFSIPENIYEQTHHIVNKWFEILSSKCKISNFCSLQMMQNIVTQPCVSM